MSSDLSNARKLRISRIKTKDNYDEMSGAEIFDSFYDSEVEDLGLYIFKYMRKTLGIDIDEKMHKRNKKDKANQKQIFEQLSIDNLELIRGHIANYLNFTGNEQPIQPTDDSESTKFDLQARIGCLVTDDEANELLTSYYNVDLTRVYLVYY